MFEKNNKYIGKDFMKIKIADYLINWYSRFGSRQSLIVYGAANGDIVDAFTRTNKIQSCGYA